MKWNRVLLKLSGEALAGPKKTGFDEDTVKEVARQVKISVDAGVEVGIVIGGGNFWRGRAAGRERRSSRRAFRPSGRYDVRARRSARGAQGKTD